MQRSYSPTSPYMNTTYAGYKFNSSPSSLVKKHKNTAAVFGLVFLVTFCVMGYYGGWGGNVMVSQMKYNNFPQFGKTIYNFSQTGAGKAVYWMLLILSILGFVCAGYGHGMFNGVKKMFR